MNPAGRILVARLDSLGLALPVASLLEVRAGSPGTDAAEDIVPRLDLWCQFALTPAAPAGAGLLVRTSRGACLIPVTRVEGLRSATDGILCEVPALLLPRTGNSYRRVLLLDGEPLIWCEPDLWFKG